MNEDNLISIGRVFGKREMLLYIQKACVANGDTLTLADINKYSKVVGVDEMVWADDIPHYEMELDRDIREASLNIAKE